MIIIMTILILLDINRILKNVRWFYENKGRL